MNKEKENILLKEYRISQDINEIFQLPRTTTTTSKKKTIFHLESPANLPTMEELDGQVDEARRSLTKGESSTMPKLLHVGRHFLTFYAVVYRRQDVRIPLQEDLWKVFMRSLNYENETEEMKLMVRNALKMVVHLICLFGRQLELALAEQDASQLVTGRRTKKKPKANLMFDGKWEEKKTELIRLLTNIFSTEFRHLWTPPMPEHDLVSIVAELAQTFLRNGNISKSAQKDLLNGISSLFGLLATRFEFPIYHGLMTSLRTVADCHLMVAHVLGTLVSDFDDSIMAAKVITEVENLQNDEQFFNANSTTVKNASHLLAELAQRIPAVVHQHLSSVWDFHTVGDIPSIRLGVIELDCELICGLLHGEDLSPALAHSRDQILEQMCRSSLDVNANVRSKVMKLLQRIVAESKLPPAMTLPVMRNAVSRTADVASSVRSSAMLLVIELLRNNRVPTKFRREELESQGDGLRKRLRKLGVVLNEEDENDNDNDNEADDENRSNGSGRDSQRNGDGDKTLVEENGGLEEETAVEGETDEELVIRLKCKLNFIDDCVAFSLELERCVENVEMLLFSETQSDVLDAIAFYIDCYKLGYIKAMVGIRKMLPLVNVNPRNEMQRNVLRKVVEGYETVFIQETKSPVERIVVLIDLIREATLGDMDALAEVLSHFVNMEHITGEHFKIVWDLFTGKFKTVSAELDKSSDMKKRQIQFSSLNFLRLVCMRHPELIKSNLGTLCHYVLVKPEADQLNYALIEEFACILESLGTPRSNEYATDKTTEKIYTPKRLALNDKDGIFKRLAETVVLSFVEESGDHFGSWDTMVSQVVKAVYLLAEKPYVWSAGVLRALLQILGLNGKLLQANSTEDTVKHLLGLPKLLTGRLCLFLGQMVVSHNHHLMVSVLAELRRRDAANEKLTQERAKARKRRQQEERRSKRVRKNRDSTAMASSMSTELDDMDEDLGMSGAQADDGIQRRVKQSLAELFDEKSPNASLVALLAEPICALASYCMKTADENSPFELTYLATQSTMVVSKLMYVHRSFCERKMRLFITIMTKSKVALVRSNAIVALRDLLWKYPGTVEPYAKYLYRILHHDSDAVASTCLRVVAHIILNEMTKVKGHISEVARCLCHESPLMRSLARDFFQELSKKSQNSAIYNHLPDIISRLSNPEGEGPSGGPAMEPIAEEEPAEVSLSALDDSIEEQRDSRQQFNEIMEYLFSFIQKEKQKESIVDKLLKRFKEATKKAVLRDLAYCLTLVNVNETCVAVFHRHADGYLAKAASDSQISERFEAVFEKLRRNIKSEDDPQMKTIDALVHQLRHKRDKGRASHSAETGDGGNVEGDNVTHGNNGDDEDDDDDDDGHLLIPSPQRQSIGPARRGRASRGRGSRGSRGGRPSGRRGGRQPSGAAGPLPRAGRRRRKDSSEEEEEEEEEHEDADEEATEEDTEEEETKRLPPAAKAGRGRRAARKRGREADETSETSESQPSPDRPPTRQVAARSGRPVVKSQPSRRTRRLVIDDSDSE